ncbi:unnamed protein product [Brassica oleracea var. botrytis]|uniref:Uncharacterized protein n=2 Tax=Brassica TaxID=3705 RepID=A0A3P6BXU6_BRAOL|nr:unnamed protein product [Brassica oleracea]
MVDQAVVRLSHPLQSTPDEAHSGKVMPQALRIQPDTNRPVAEASEEYWQTEAEELMAELWSCRVSRAQTNMAAEHRKGHATTPSTSLHLGPEGQNGEVLAKQPKTETRGDRGGGTNRKGRGNNTLQHRRASKRDLTQI